jgi:UDP-glucuronate 4-epimerase
VLKTDSPILVTGAAGFIGFHLCKKLLTEGFQVVGLDNLNDYYDVNLKKERLKILSNFESFVFTKTDLVDQEKLANLFAKHQFEYVINLAAQAGVRYSLENPRAYMESNIIGYFNLIDLSRLNHVKHFVYASSSSVYGTNKEIPFSEDQKTETPISLYAASKKSNELIAHSYSDNFGLPTTGLRFFTVYGPWGRPDMALFLFTEAMMEGKPIKVFNHGKMKRDFTYVDDIVESVYRLIPKAPTKNIPHNVFNIGNNNSVDLMSFINEIERNVDKKATLNLLPIPTGDVPITFADSSKLYDLVDFKPSTPIAKGVKAFIDWYKEYYNKGK